MPDTKTFIITGITKGLGLALARELLRQGHTVHGCGRREDPLAGDSDFSGEYHFRQLDILETDALQEWAADIGAQNLRIDFLIHNAAVIHPNAKLWEIDKDALREVIDINIRGTFNVLQAFLPIMLKEQHGIILNLSSGAGRAGLADISGYCASKWAVEGLTKSLAQELPEGMGAIPLSPGIVDTDMLRSTFGERAADQQKPEAWAKVAAAFILDLGPQQSGQSLTVPES